MQGIVARALGGVGIRTQGHGPLDDYWYTPRAGGPNLSGVPITADSALRISVAWRCVQLLSETIGSLPLIVYRRQSDGGKTRATDHPLYAILHDQPNQWQTSVEFLSMMQLHLLLRGNAYAEIVSGARGPVDQLVPLHPDRVKVETLPDGGPRYRLRQADSTERVLLDDQVFHLRGMSLDGRTGLSVISYAGQSMGLSAAAESYSAAFFGRGSRPAGVLKTSGKLSKDGAERMRAEWQAAYGGPGNSHRTAVLEEGLEWVPIAFNAEDSQLIQSREWQAADIARWFGVPLHLVQLETKDTSWGSGIESLGSGFVTFTLQPWLQRWEQKIGSRLMLAPGVFQAEFLLDSLLRGNTSERFAAYQIAAGGTAPWMSRNEIRRRENMNPLAELEPILQPMNMTTTTTTGPAQPPGGGQGATSPNGDAGDLFARDAAERVARREVAALSRAAKRAGATANNWADGSCQTLWFREVDAFYGEHMPLVAETMHLDEQQARTYVNAQVDLLRSYGPEALGDTWVSESAERLLALATGRVE